MSASQPQSILQPFQLELQYTLVYFERNLNISLNPRPLNFGFQPSTRTLRRLRSVAVPKTACGSLTWTATSSAVAVGMGWDRPRWVQDVLVAVARTEGGRGRKINSLSIN